MEIVHRSCAGIDIGKRRRFLGPDVGLRLTPAAEVRGHQTADVPGEVTAPRADRDPGCHERGGSPGVACALPVRRPVGRASDEDKLGRLAPELRRYERPDVKAHGHRSSSPA